MTRVLVKQGRGLVAVVALLALAVAACGSGGGPTLPGNNNPTGNGGTGQPGGTGGGFASGLSTNLNTLDNYQFSWSLVAGSSGASASSGATISGIVVNKPAQAIQVNDFGILFIQIGDKAWMSLDKGTTWMVDDSFTPGDTSISDMLPTKDYASWFDDNATSFTSAGSENKNGVDCTHFKGNSSLGAGFAAFGVAADFHADLWVAKNGNYPVSGVYGFSAATSSEAASWGYTFDITHINDPANKVTQPANVTALPS